ncbi:hypothetical protein [Pedobacter frigoris]|uniref:Uncharacterized protein n=1 Tax=Pedobacter frigoris TaxID=2571272 RepID=A0A4U1CEX2_9SPHI|nr:hypothetical protein [Pedobacter frigoris]TKC03991.1 hypothetical protein FA047_18790 [Pedobacter frigoris]
MRKLTILTFLLLFNLIIKAQVSPIGASKAIEQSMNHPVSYNTGLPQIQIPLYDIDFGGSKIPISLSYHAGGLKMNQKSGLVGAGWSISTNFQISRTVRGREDEYYPMTDLDSMYLEGTQADMSSYPSNTFYNSAFRDMYLSKFIFPDPARDGSSTSIYHADLHTTDYRDSEMDIFRYNLFNTSGRFVFTSRSPYVISTLDESFLGTDIKFFNGPIASQYFAVKDEQGTQYEFGKDAAIQFVYTDVSAINTAWMLKSATALNGDTVSFSYFMPWPSEKRFGKSVHIKEGCKECFPYNESIYNYVRSDSSGVTYGQDQIPAGINFPEGIVTYGYQNMTIGGVVEDLINEIKIMDLDSNLIRKVNLYYTQGLRFAFLDSVKINGGSEQALVYRFTYQMKDQNNVLFDSLALGTDNWGYLSKRVNNIVKKTSIPFNEGIGQGVSIYKPDYGTYGYLEDYVSSMEFDTRLVNTATPPIYLLKEIKYPKGGTTTYSFENHLVSSSPYQVYGPGAGYRVREIISNDGIIGQAQRRTFTYGDNDDDSPQSGNIPLGTGYVLNMDNIVNWGNTIRQGAEIGVLPDNLGDPSNWILYNTYNFSNQYKGNLDFAGFEENPVYYAKVTEKIYNGNVAISKTEFVYDSLINVIKPSIPLITERNTNPNIAGRGVISRIYKPENFRAVILGYKPKMLSATNYQMIQSTWKKTSREEYTYTGSNIDDMLTYGSGLRNIRISNYAMMAPDYSGGMSLEGIYTSTGIQSVFDFNSYLILPYPNRFLSSRIVTKYTE